MMNAFGGTMTLCLMLGLMFCFPMISKGAAADDEAAARTKFATQFKDSKPENRIEALKLLAGVRQEKSVALLASALKDSSVDVRKAAAETLEGVTDGAGAGVKPLCEVLANKKEKTAVRLAAAKALAKSSYKADPIKGLIIAITIEENEIALWNFGVECVKILNVVAGKDFEMDKETPGKWAKWYKENQAKLVKQDQETYAAYKKGAGKG
jgi:hypothetical protein